MLSNYEDHNIDPSKYLEQYSKGVLDIDDTKNTDERQKIFDEFKEKKVIAVFGCGGDRDKEKRPEMGIIGYELADEIILTSDNPRSEDPVKIIEDIETGIKAKYPEAKYNKIVDRGKAINKAIMEAEKDDIIIIFGKGHETYQEFADKIIDFDDRKVASQALNQRSGGK